MGAVREELQVGGSCLLKTRMRFGGGGSSIKTHKAEVLEFLGKATARVRTDDGRELTVRYNELLPDEVWLSEQDRKEQAKRARIERESQLPAPPPKPAGSEPLKVSMADLLKQYEAKLDAPPAEEEAPCPDLSKQQVTPPPPLLPPESKREPASELRLVPSEPVPAKKPKSVPPPAPPQAIAPAPVPSVAASQLSAWLDMGRDVLRPIEQELATLRKERAALRSRREAAEREFNANVERTREMQRQRATVQNVLAGVDPSHTIESEPDDDLALTTESNLAARQLVELQRKVDLLKRWVTERKGQRWQGAWIKKQVFAILQGDLPEEDSLPLPGERRA